MRLNDIYKLHENAVVARREGQRRARLGDLVKLFQMRYARNGYVFTDDDAGRGDLIELLKVISLGLVAVRKRMVAACQIWAPWMPDDEASELIESIMRKPIYERVATARELGNRLRLTNAEREQLPCKTIKPVDMTDEQLVAQSRAKARARERKRRLERGGKTRAESLSRTKPWVALGMCRRTWERHRAKRAVANSCEPRVISAAHELATPVPAEKP